jgi:tRNA(Ile)-lysidine synthase
VALSGGGDSLALTLIADAWARARGRELVILTVDHQLRPESIFWTRRCAAVAERLGRPFRAMAWEGEKPATGLPAAARSARHRLLADAAREAGARVILMGHTADDIAEAHAMRAAGSTTPDPHEWAPSPVWPEGRGVFVLRPLLKQRRADLRAWLEARDETWIDDPGNDDPRFARSRARAAGAQAVAGEEADPSLELFRLADHFAGRITIYRQTVRKAEPGDVLRFVGLACVCAGGGERRPPTERLRRLADALRGDENFVATLAGARIEAGMRSVDILREPGEFRRRGAILLPLPYRREVVWDGRFAVTAQSPGLVMRPLAGVASALPHEERVSLGVGSANAVFSASLRGGLPAVIHPDGEISTPFSGWSRDGVAIESLVPARLEAAAGLVQREPA